MPILAPEPQISPPGLLDPKGMDPTAERICAERIWWVLHTRPRQEKSLARDLHASEVPFFLPLARRQNRIRGRIFTSHLPLFAGYLFVCVNHDEHRFTMSSPRVVHSLRVADQDQLVRDLEQVYRLVQLGAPIAAEDRMVSGAIVEIQSGPLAGLRGKIVQESTRKRFVVEVDFIQRAASILLDGDLLMPIGD
jgi:transcriptional antiterminator RfaH